jgi:gamma-glutamylcyclotransferase (GGCT)/AIG2-like uncharacterized protein YtfP
MLHHFAVHHFAIILPTPDLGVGVEQGEMQQTHCDHLFVYGTLRRGADTGMARMLAEAADFVAEARFQGRLYLIDDYPGVVASDDPDDIVVGDLYRMHRPESLLSQLDAYEGYDPALPDASEFVRSIQTVAVSHGVTRAKAAWIYLYARSVAGLKRIFSGDFLHTW